MSIVFVGAGNMARSIIGGLLEQGLSAPSITACAPSAASLQNLQETTGINITQDNIAAVGKAETVVLCVKPQIMSVVCEQLREHIPDHALIVSVAAGISCASLHRWLGESRAIIRCMPNTPSLIGMGASGLFASAGVSTTQRQQAETLLQAVGIVEWVEDESLIDAVTAVSGSGPAYFFLMLEAIIEAGTAHGLDEATATRLAIQTARGAAELAKTSELSLSELRRKVTSPGGTTEQAISSFEGDDFRGTVKRAMQACVEHSRHMARQLDN